MENNFYLQWFKKGNHDIETAEFLLKEKYYAETICFLAQQSIEKYLKGYLTFKNKKFKKTHDLGDLLNLCIEINKNFEKFIDECRKITTYYIPSRYPSLIIEEFTEEDAKYSVKKAREIIKFILNLVNKKKEVKHGRNVG